MNKLIYTIFIVFCLSLNCKAQAHKQYIKSNGAIDAIQLMNVIDDIDADKLDKKAPRITVSFSAKLKLTTPNLFDVYWSSDTRTLWIATGTVQNGFVCSGAFGATP